MHNRSEELYFKKTFLKDLEPISPMLNHQLWGQFFEPKVNFVIFNSNTILTTNFKNLFKIFFKRWYI